MADFCVGDTGATLDVTVTEHGGSISLVGVGGKSFVIKKPDGSHVTWTAIFKTDGTDGVLRYITATAADLDQPGDWQGQVSLVGLGNWTGKSLTNFNFNVRAAL